jgi:hypothetical protein
MDPLPPIETPLVAPRKRRRKSKLRSRRPPPPAAAPPTSAARGKRAFRSGDLRREPPQNPRLRREKSPSPKPRAPCQSEAPSVRDVSRRPAAAHGIERRAAQCRQSRSANASDAEQARAQQELANAIEAETVVLRRSESWN